MNVASIDSLQISLSEAEKSELRREGFIDEALVQEMVISHAQQLQRMNREKMAASSEEADYAGWNLSSDHSSDRAA